MKQLLSSIFKNHGFSLIDTIWNEFDTQTYTNNNSEVYILVFVEEIPYDLHASIVSLCSNEIFNSNLLTKAQKSNLYVIIMSKVALGPSDNQLNQVFMIEENGLYYKKFFMWYSPEELQCLNELLQGDISSENMNRTLVDYNQFDKFKVDNKGYALLSRLYIKLAFLTLNDIKTLDKSLLEYIESNISKINKNLFNEIIGQYKRDGNIDDCIKMIEVDAKDEKDVEKLMKEVRIDEF